MKKLTHTLRRTVAAFALLCALTALARADVIQGRVVGVADGDTITILDASKSQHKIRLQGIDAPESRQAFGGRSKQHLSDLVFNKEGEKPTVFQSADESADGEVFRVCGEGREG